MGTSNLHSILTVKWNQLAHQSSLSKLKMTRQSDILKEQVESAIKMLNNHIKFLDTMASSIT